MSTLSLAVRWTPARQRRRCFLLVLFRRNAITTALVFGKVLLALMVDKNIPSALVVVIVAVVSIAPLFFR